MVNRPLSLLNRLNAHAQKPYLWLLAAWALLLAATWTTAVPAWLSGTTLMWGNAAALALSLVVLRTLRGAGPTRSIAHVLYDVENPPAKIR